MLHRQNVDSNTAATAVSQQCTHLIFAGHWTVWGLRLIAVHVSQHFEIICCSMMMCSMQRRHTIRSLRNVNNSIDEINRSKNVLFIFSRMKWNRNEFRKCDSCKTGDILVSDSNTQTKHFLKMNHLNWFDSCLEWCEVRRTLFRRILVLLRHCLKNMRQFE